MTAMTDVYQLALRSDADEEEFLAFARQDGPRLVSVTRAGTVTGQTLLKEIGTDDSRRHLWCVRWNLHFDLEVVGSVPPSLWKLKDDIESRAEIISFARYAQAEELAVA